MSNKRLDLAAAKERTEAYDREVLAATTVGTYSKEEATFLLQNQEEEKPSAASN